MNYKKIELDSFSQSVLDGIRRSTKKLIIEKAASNKNMIVADKDGNPISVPAKELLKSM